jgi:GntR family transcriptional regulator
LRRAGEMPLTPLCVGDVVHYITVFLLNPNSGVPLYLQLQQQIQQRILSGQLPDGAQLPSARDLSAELRVNPLTVTKVYQNLEREGFVETKRGLGTYVSHQSPALKLEARRRQIGPALEQLVVEALHLGLGEKEIQALVSEKFQQFKPRTGRRTHDE